jgi:hypothetical protein
LIENGGVTHNFESAGVSKFFYNRRYFLNFRRYLKIRLRAVRGPGGGSS